jgi:GDP-L-fucose synthase
VKVFGLSRSDVDLSSGLATSSKLAQVNPDLVIHTAAKVGGIQANISQPVEFLARNLEVDRNVILNSLEIGIPQLIYVGSSCMYPKDYRQPLRESDLLMGPLEPTNEGYALAKIVGAKLCEFASSTAGVSYRTVIPSNLYGPGDNFDPKTSHLLASVIRKVHEAKLAGRNSIEVWGSGEARREFTYIEDLAEWMVETATRVEMLPQYLNLGLGKDYSVTDFYKAAMRVIGVEAELSYDPTKPDGMKQKLLDSSVARESADWDPPTTIEEGIEETYQWYLKQL